jgi:hypothetical protein
MIIIVLRTAPVLCTLRVAYKAVQFQLGCSNPSMLRHEPGCPGM